MFWIFVQIGPNTQNYVLANILTVKPLLETIKPVPFQILILVPHHTTMHAISYNIILIITVQYNN